MSWADKANSTTAVFIINSLQIRQWRGRLIFSRSGNIRVEQSCDLVPMHQFESKCNVIDCNYSRIFHYFCGFF